MLNLPGCIVLPPGVAKIFQIQKFKDLTNLTQIFHTASIGLLLYILKKVNQSQVICME